MSKKYDYLVKIILLGESGAGKSSLMLKFADGTYVNSISPTIGIDFKIRYITLPHTNTIVKLQIIDTAGHERFRAITRSHYRNAQGALIIYDVTNIPSFENTRYWITECLNYKSIDKPYPIILVGTKCDMIHNRKISTDQGLALAKEFGLAYYETSAINNMNVNAVFECITQRIVDSVKTPNLTPQITLEKITRKKLKRCS